MKEENITFHLIYSTFKSLDKWQRYYSFTKSVPNHRSLTLRQRGLAGNRISIEKKDGLSKKLKKKVLRIVKVPGQAVSVFLYAIALGIIFKDGQNVFRPI